MLLIRLALRNLSRNRTRTIINLAMVVGALTAVILFKGFSNSMLETLELIFTKSQTGHIQIAKKTIWKGDVADPKEAAYIDDHSNLTKALLEMPEVEQASGRVTAHVLLSNGEKTVGAQVIGFDPVREKSVNEYLTYKEGKGFVESDAPEVVLGAGVHSQLGTKLGQTISVIGQSLAGSMSSLDPEVKGVVMSGLSAFDNVTIYLPLASAQRLLETDKVEKLFVLLKDGRDLKKVMTKVNLLIKDNPDLEAREWKVTNAFIGQVEDFYGLQNQMVVIILGILVFFGILNTVGISIYERIGEIGTMRAIGDQKPDILSLFMVEVLLLGFFGSVIGVPFAAITSWVITALKIEMVMPGASDMVPVTLAPGLKDFANASGMVVLTCLISCLWPARKALKVPIVDALRANS